MAFVRKWKWAIIIAAVLIAAIGVWQWWPKEQAPSPGNSMVEDITEPVRPVVYGPPVPPRWAWNDIPWRLTKFTPPAGHWVYYSEWNREFLVIPGKPLPEGAPAPDEAALYAQAVVVMSEVHFDTETFSSWEDMELTMAEFACARGASEEVYVLCTREPFAIVTGTNPSRLPFRSFAYPHIAYQTKERIGTARFTVVRLGVDGTFGLLLYALNEARGQVPMRALAQSLVRTVADLGDAAFLEQ